MTGLVAAMAHHLEGWSEDLLLELVALARFRLFPDPQFVRRLSSATGLLPPQEFNPLTGASLKRTVPRFTELSSWSAERAEALGALRSSINPRLDDEHVLAIWPYRAKTDLSIRRTRFADCYAVWREAKQLETFWGICDRLAGFDYIAVCNILNASWLLSDQDFSWFNFWDELGAFASDVSHYTAVCKYVNDQVKKYPVDKSLDRFRIAECGVMTGYRNPPFPGFDVVDETRALAEGGGRHGLTAADSLSVFTRLADEVLDADGEVVEWVGFYDFVASGLWETAGSSSVGRVEWEYAGEKGHFKARKNLVPDVYDLEALAAEAALHGAQINKAIIKSELGKLRVAVSSDMFTYLKMSWLTRYMGGAYKKWPGSTIEEDVFEQTDRMLDMLRAICRAWNLPFDYAGFDHQPETSELKAIVRVLVRIGRRTVAAEHHAEYDAMAAEVLDGFDHSTLSVVDPTGGRHVFPVTGGVMSGLRWTTILGNGWNTVMTAWVMRIMHGLGVDVSDVKRWIRGDDSAIVTDSYAKTLLFRLGYEAVGAIGADGKFGIHSGASEFLRVWYSQEGCRGYASRAVPGLLQRKPWSSAPWEEESVMTHLFDGTRTLRRRGCDPARVALWWKAVKLNWSRRNKVSQTWLQIPKVLGGLGVEPWDGTTFTRVRWPRTDTLSLSVTNQTPWRATQLVHKYSSLLPITGLEASGLARRMLAAKVASDDVPSLNSIYRAQSSKPKSSDFYRESAGWNVPGANELVINQRMLAATRATKGSFRQAFDGYNDDSYGLHRRVAQKWADVSEVFRLRRQHKVLAWFADHEPEFVREVRRLERRGLARWEALDWTFGTLPLGVTSTVHPALTGLLHRAVVSVAKGFVQRTVLRPRQLTQLVAQATAALERGLLSSQLSQVVYSW